MDDGQRWRDASHAVQTGVAMEHAMGSKDQEPKHLRVGINSALCDQAGLVRLLVEKNLITEEEYLKAIADEMEREKKRYEDRLGVTLA